MIKYLKLIIKHMRLLISIFLFRKPHRLNNEELVYYTRINIHAVEKAQINEQYLALILQLFEIIPFYRLCVERNLFSQNELNWAKRILFSKDEEKEEPLEYERSSEFDAVIANRRSVRKYIDKPVEREKIIRIIKNAIWAPSACNRQPWRFIIFSDRDGMEMFANFIQKFILNVPTGILIIQSKEAYNEIDIHYTPYLDAGIVSQNIMLSAQNEGLGSCFVNTGDYELSKPQVEKIKHHFDIPDDWIITGLITLGYPKYTPHPPGRKVVEDVMMFGRFDEKNKFNGKKPKPI